MITEAFLCNLSWSIVSYLYNVGLGEVSEINDSHFWKFGCDYCIFIWSLITNFLVKINL